MAKLLNADSDASKAAVSPPAKTVFEEFLLAEYNNIAQAHFNTVTSISEFFKHYIVIVSLPISVALIFLKPSELKTSGILDFLVKYPLLPTMLLVLITLLGLTVLGYVINLRFDAILYARTVNGIRRYFSESSGHAGEEAARFLALPTSTHFPLYIESGYFFFVVLTFAIVGTAYVGGGLYLHRHLKEQALDTTFWFLVGFCGWFHLFLYAFLGWKRERGYLRGPVIGVDMDGVLNKHRTHFVEILKAQTGKHLDPESITTIPVHQIPHTIVEREDECAVFNWPGYWTNMPPLEDAVNCVKRLRIACGYRIWIFTHRDWPQQTTYPTGRENEYNNAWKKDGSIRKITSQWLRQHGFTYNRLIVERVNTEAVDLPIFRRNRFWASKYMKIRFFVEDDLNKAKKLSAICTIVFLLDHPYNQTELDDLPRNIVRVMSWQEIYEFIKQAS